MNSISKVYIATSSAYSMLDRQTHMHSLLLANNLQMLLITIICLQLLKHCYVGQLMI